MYNVPEARGFNTYAGCANSLHVGEPVAEGDPTRPGGIFELVRVKPRIDDAAEQVVEHDGKLLRRHRQQPVQHTTYNHGILKEIGLGRKVSRRLATKIVGVADIPRSNFNFLQNRFIL